MLTIKKILFPTDFSECAEHAFDHAAQLAADFNAEVHVFHTRVHQGNPYPVLSHLIEEADEEEAAGIAPPHAPNEKSLKAPRGEQVIVIQAERTGSSACDSILEYAKEHDTDLIVMGTHGRRGPKRLLIGSTAECVVRSSDCPVLTLRSDATTMKEHKLTNLLVPVDFSDFSEEAVKYAAQLAKTWDARVTLLHIVEEAVLPTVYGVEPVALYSVDHVLDASTKALNEMKDEFFDESIDVDTRIVVGHAASSIADWAKELNADLVVISTHGLTGMKRFLMGSVTELVVRTAPCAVLTVKPFGKRLIDTPVADEAVVSASS